MSSAVSVTLGPWLQFLDSGCQSVRVPRSPETLVEQMECLWGQACWMGQRSCSFLFHQQAAAESSICLVLNLQQGPGFTHALASILSV